MKHLYDIIIVGAGIAGLYSAYKILRRAPNTRILVIERSSRKLVGGRANNALFQGVSVVTGAGIGRFKKDTLLKQLLHDFKIPIHTFSTKIHHAPSLGNCDIKSIFQMLKREYVSRCDVAGHKIHAPFKDFATSILGKHDYNAFITCVGYTDYEKEDVYDTLYHYGFDDNYSEYLGFSVPWHLLIHKMVDFIGSVNFLFSSTVSRIDSIEGFGFQLHVENENNGKQLQYFAEKVIVATTIDSIQRLIPVQSNLYRQIHGQPFLRIYGKFAKSCIAIMKTLVPAMTSIPGPLQKILPMDSDKGVYMISYSDNRCAHELTPFLENTAKNREHLSRMLETALGLSPNTLSLLAITDYYWGIGTHYYEPLKGDAFKTRQDFIKKVQRPMADLWVVGEAVALKQGWVEGALESVDAVYKSW